MDLDIPSNALAQENAIVVITLTPILTPVKEKTLTLLGYSLKRIRPEEQPQESLAELSFLEQGQAQEPSQEDSSVF